MAVAEYGEGRVHIFDRDGHHLNTLKVSMPFVDTVIWDDAGNLYAGGSFQNSRPPFEGAVVRFSPERVGAEALTNWRIDRAVPAVRFTRRSGA